MFSRAVLRCYGNGCGRGLLVPFRSASAAGMKTPATSFTSYFDAQLFISAVRPNCSLARMTK